MLPGRKRTRAWLALAAFVATFGLPLAVAGGHLAIADDAACTLSVPRPLDVAQAQIQNADSAVPEHCQLCHFQRDVNGATPSPLVRISAPFREVAVLISAGGRAGAPALAARPSRGPPVLL